MSTEEQQKKLLEAASVTVGGLADACENILKEMKEDVGIVALCIKDKLESLQETLEKGRDVKNFSDPDFSTEYVNALIYITGCGRALKILEKNS